MLGASRGEILLVAFIFALVWGAGVLPRFAAQLAERRREREGGGGKASDDRTRDRG
ncbi:MAG TPA: hypothetical protein VHV30_15655 [Polyangiaceae bacterium]|jgi:Sec-independent protein translocase protein TatA|nr:hypothetical protein [Polyangiaceae bacterium]